MRLWIISISIALVLTVLGFSQSDEPQKSAVKLAGDEQKLLELTNAERKKEELPTLTANPVLCRVARGHSQNMAKQEKLDHVLDDKTPFDRLDDAKYSYQGGAENVAVSADPKLDMAGILKLWMDSEVHRKNILNSKYTEIGIGIVKNDKGEVYVTQVFATPLKK